VLDLITSDVVVLAGGGYLFSATRKVNASLIHSLAIIWLAVLSRKPIVMMPQSIGPLRGRFDRWIVKRTLSKVGPIVVREGAAYAEVEQLLHSATTSLVPDVALYGWGAKARRERPRVPTARRRVGIVVMDWTWARAAPPDELTRYVRKLVTLIESLEAHAVDSLLLGGSNLPQANQDDMIVVRRIAELAIERGGRPTIAEMSDPETFRLLLRTLDVVIGTRLHSCLLALASGVPAIALGYQPKSGGTYDLLGIGELCYDVQTFDPVALAEHVTSILATQLEWDERVTRAADNARRTIEDFYAQV
jgi:polysaccharide pyruvyl transferase WcaK-like protein